MRKMTQNQKEIALTFFVFVVLMIVCSITQSVVAQQPQSGQQPKLANTMYSRLLKTTTTPTGNVHGRTRSSLIKGSVSTGSVCIFTGIGSWSDPLNWQNKLVPPTRLKPGDQIIINGTGMCLLNDANPVFLVSGTSIEIKEGKELYITIGNNFILRGNLINNGTIKVLSGTLVTGFAQESTSTTKGHLKTTSMSKILERKISTKEMKVQ